MNAIDRATIIHYHRHRIASFGANDVRALGWRSSESQRKRFELIAAAADCTGAKLLDVGCGRADLKAYLDDRFDGVHYLGLDQLPEFIAAARARFASCPRGSFHCADFSTAPLPMSDIVVACGSLSYRSAVPDFHADMIRRLWAVCADVLIVNLLDAATFPAHPPLVGQDVGAVMDLARALAPQAELIRSGLDDDFTVVLRRVPRAR
jgi:trans-aconitate methyltransferase